MTFYGIMEVPFWDKYSYNLRGDLFRTLDEAIAEQKSLHRDYSEEEINFKVFRLEEVEE